MTVSVDDRLLHQLVAGSHAEGTTCLAVAAAIEHGGRTLLISTADDDFEPLWRLPTDLVLPGETLLQALERTVTMTTGLGIASVTGYAGHHDQLLDAEIVRTFVFTVTAGDPGRVCRWSSAPHLWSSDPVTASSVVGYKDSPVTCRPTAAPLMRTQPLDQLCDALRSSARGLLCTEAAIELLIQQQSWLHRSDFVEHFIDSPDPTGEPASHMDAAFIDWLAAMAALDQGNLPCSSGEEQLLRIAASLAEGIPVDLRDTLTRLDASNTRLLARVILHASGHRP